MLTRVITAIVFTLVILAGIALQGWVLRALILFAALLSMGEMYRALRAKGHDPVRWAGYLFTCLCCLFEILKAELHVPFFTAVDPILCALVLGILIATTVVVFRGKVVFDSVESTLFPMLYPGVLFGLMMGIQDMSDRFTVTVVLLLMFFAASVNDVFALFIGIRFGKHRLSPEISPKKSIEGSVAGLIASTLFSMLVPAVFTRLAVVWPAIDPTGAVLPALWRFALLGFFGGAASQIGDLTASMVKRHCGIKDFGTIFPGHGGMMDRMDGVLYCTAICWFFFHLAGL